MNQQEIDNPKENRQKTGTEVEPECPIGIKICSTSLIINERQSVSTMKCYFITTRLSNKKNKTKRLTITCWQEYWTTGNLGCGRVNQK